LTKVVSFEYYAPAVGGAFFVGEPDQSVTSHQTLSTNQHAVWGAVVSVQERYWVFVPAGILIAQAAYMPRIVGYLNL